MAKKGKSQAKKCALYKNAGRKESNKLRKQKRQLAKHPNDTTNPLHEGYAKAEAHREAKEREEIRHHPSVFDGKPRNHKKKKRNSRPLGFLAEVPLTLKEN